MQYSTMFFTEYDQPHPVGTIGHGNHYSILSFPQPFGLNNELSVGTVRKQLLSVIWDKDHDDRIIYVLEHAHVNQLLAPVMFVGECKGKVRVVVDDRFELTDDYIDQWHKAVTWGMKWVGRNRNVEDDWQLEVLRRSDVGTHGLIVADKHVVNAYLDNICHLWNVGQVEFYF